MDNIEADKVEEFVVEKKRGFWLSTFLILMIIFNSLTAYIYTTSPEVFTTLNSRSTNSILYLFIFIAVINVIFSAAIWVWKKWGVYGFYASIIIVFFVNLYLGIGFLGSLPGLVGGLILFFFIKKKWVHFS